MALYDKNRLPNLRVIKLHNYSLNLSQIRLKAVIKNFAVLLTENLLNGTSDL